MSNSAPKIVFVATANKEIKTPEDLRNATVLPSKKAYFCAIHPKKPAFCMCAKCGSMLCEDCHVSISGRNYCETCLSQDDALIESFEKELIRPKFRPNEAIVCEVPKKLGDIPHAILNMIKDSSIFFKTAKDAPFGLTFALAFVALVPNALVRFLFKFDASLSNVEKTFENTPELSGVIALVKQMPPASLACTAVVMTVLQILMLDLIMFGAMKVFTKSNITFAQTGSTLHFCLLPLIFTALGSWYDNVYISGCALVLMIIQTTTAARVSTNCTTLQGIGVMLSFIFISTMLGII